jgi:protocatechuate 3,4-dioxygenase, beta subunit
MNYFDATCSRRQMIAGGLALGTLSLFAPGVFAEHLASTPDMTEGPFYPTRLPLDQDNDLILVNDSTTPALGEITHLTGRILDASGNPLNNVEIEIWQCDAREVYHLTRDEAENSVRMDKNFQGFGRFATGSTGEYRFRTIKPVPYPGRPAGHIHFKIKQNGHELLTSQIFVAGAPGNSQDGIFRSIRDPIDRELIQTEFVPIKDSKIGELAATFDIVVGRTPADPHDDHPG